MTGHITEHDGDGDEVRRGGGRRTSPLKAAGLALAAVLALSGAGAGWVYWQLNDNINSVDINSALGDDRPAKPTPSVSTSAATPPAEALNILVLGSDSRSGAENQALGGGDSTGARSDTAMVVHLGAGRTEATVVSIPRDTLVTRPSCPLESGGESAEASNVMFNSAYSVGGPVCAVKTVESMTNVRMDHYVEIDFAGFARLVDALGGVTVTTEEDIDDEDSHLTLPAGTHHLDGEQALGLARTRHGIGDGSDLGRIGLQQQLVKALMERIAATSLLSDPTRLYEVADAVTGSLTTDTGLDSLTELVGLGQSLRGLSADAMETVMMPVVTAAWDRNRVVADEPEAGELWESLR
ncbi:transcriptional regulator [Streptomyces spinoverrucosus]|uniref:Transcriptional regulator n=1 Tax=Streptomyces spinoverrucosus TaxID=284043 RepID=A0A4Y3VIX8_9ACTN|nr:LCP family protein [Streptomyces spinoverrucosus]GEC04976.1 transcriptional regulator [Streptomyces spinoverrucosus]GHB61061.1 transcriptional regulator [Streptomyces spinoverrucosus]